MQQSQLHNTMTQFTVSGQIVDLIKKKIFPGRVVVQGDKILSIEKTDQAENQFILPGFIDAHIHIESSLLTPAEFARIATIHGTVATVSDPHEIGNVLGVEGVRYMLDNGKKVPFHFFFGAPSCVPATKFETAGAEITTKEIQELFEKDGLKYLSEVMNYPGVLQNDPEIMDKIKVAKALGKKIDGHAPGLMGKEAKRYIEAGMSTDHEAYTLEEALDKIQYGMHILIREGSAAKNFEALHPLIASHPNEVMFCNDDKDTDDLIRGHINEMVKRAVAHQYPIFNVLRIACVNPVIHYGLEVGLLQAGDSADFIVVDNLKDFRVKETYIRGKLVAKNGKSLLPHVTSKPINHFCCTYKKPQDFVLKSQGNYTQVIEVQPGELITKKLYMPAQIEKGNYVADPKNDLFKLAVVNRYKDAPPAIAFVKGLGFRGEAMASSIAHDSHNIIAVGSTDAALCEAINTVISSKGGICVIKNQKKLHLPLPIAGLMSDQDAYEVAKALEEIKKKGGELGFMTLSFLALLVIPALKLSDLGLFDVDLFCFTDVASSRNTALLKSLISSGSNAGARSP